MQMRQLFASLLAKFNEPSLGHLRLAKHWEGEPTQCAPLWQRKGICRTAFGMLPYLRSHEDIEYIRRALLLPDAPDLLGVVGVDTHRGNLLTCEGASDRFRRWFPVRLRAIRERELKAFGLEEMEDVK
jgi:hypothetical protein